MSLTSRLKTLMSDNQKSKTRSRLEITAEFVCFSVNWLTNKEILIFKNVRTENTMLYEYCWSNKTQAFEILPILNPGDLIKFHGTIDLNEVNEEVLDAYNYKVVASQIFYIKDVFKINR